MLLIKNGRIVDPKNDNDEVADILIKEDRILKIEKNIEKFDDVAVIDATGYVIAPGLIDVHVHFRDPGFTYKEDIQTGSNAAARGGFTTVICMANTNPAVDNEKTLEYVIKESKKAKINILQTASVTKGLKGKELVEMECLKSKGVVGFTDDGLPIMDSSLAIRAMEIAKKLDVPLSLHEEDPSLIVCSGINHGVISKQLGIEGARKEAEEVMVARDCMLAIATGAKVHIQHVSTANSVEFIKLAKKLGSNITAEATPHHFSLTEEAVLQFKSNAKMNPPLRTEKDRLKIIEGLADGTIEIIATDHAPHSKEEKEREFTQAPSGIIGLETALSLGITNLVLKKHISLIKLIEKMTINPAKLYNLSSGFIAEGAIADLVIFNPYEKQIFNQFASKSSNSPYLGKELYGKIKYTICNGNIVYEDKK